MMASRNFSRTLRASLSRPSTLPSFQRRSFCLARANFRSATIAPGKPIRGSPLLITRGLKTVDFAGHKETVYGKEALINS